MAAYRLVSRKDLLKTLLFIVLLILSPVHSAWSGAAILSWDPPTTNTDGTLLTDLAGHKIYYGTSAGNYTNTLDVGNRTTYQLGSLTDGITYYFAVTAYNIYGSESAFSNQVSKAMPAAQFNLTVTKTGNGTGMVTSSPAGISCGTACSGTYAAGALVTLTATPDTASTLSGWSGACTGTGTCSVTMTAAQAVSASFSLKTYSISASSGIGGSITPSGPVFVNHGSSRTFTITPNTGYSIADVLVDGVSTGQVSTYTFDNVTADHTIVANFVLKTYTITAAAGPGGSISPSGVVVTNHGSNGTFTITPGPNYGIADVLVDGTSVGAVDIYTFRNIESSHTIDASFATNTYTLNLIKSGSGTGTVTSSPAGISCGSICSGTYGAGSVVALSAVPDANSTFVGWSGACTGTSACSVTMDDAKTISSLFTLKADYEISCSDTGIPCVDRLDGGNDADNLVNGSPKADIQYEFRVVVKDTGGAPTGVRLFLTQRNSPQPGEFAAYPMTCSGDYGAGAVCIFRTKLGPASVHKFFIETTMSDGTTIMRYPQTSLLNGPTVNLLTGYNLVGIPRIINGQSLDGHAAFGSQSTYRWRPDLGYYTEVTAAEPVSAGEGYFSYKAGNSLPEFEGYMDFQDAEYAWPLKAGWNIVSTPFGKNIRLADIKVRKGSEAPLNWQEAAAAGWLLNAVYSFNGSDWGNTYSWDSGTNAVLIPWVGYQIYLNNTDAAYTLIFPRL